MSHNENFSSLRSKDTAKDESLRSYVNQKNKSGGFYHQLDFGDGVVAEGEYELEDYFPHFHFPKSLKGKSVLDIGPASGFFTLASARLGGKVTAIDTFHESVKDFSEVLDADISLVKKNIYDLDESFGQFDLVVCGSLLLHLPDLVGALQRIRSVCKGRAIISTGAIRFSSMIPFPIMKYIGIKNHEESYWTYWSLSAAALKKMLLDAGFSSVENVEHFTLKSLPGKSDFAVKHVVMTAIV